MIESSARARGQVGTIRWRALVDGRPLQPGQYVVDVIARAGGRITSRELPVS
jgi:hypothetical protein